MLNETCYKYPKTFHFSFSPNLQNDDRMLPDVSVFRGKHIVVTEKLDGESTGMTQDSVHARSVDGRDHPSRHWIKALHAQIKNDIPKGWKIFGENMYAEHSLAYHRLTSFFYVFLIVDQNMSCLSWKDTVLYSSLLGLETVPLIYEGMWDEEIVENISVQSAFGDEAEGYVVRNAESYPFADFQENTGKVVRNRHVRTDDHWMKTWKPNQLA